MKIVLISIIIVLVIINLICFGYGKKYLKNVKDNSEDSELNYKKGMRYIIVAVVISFITILGVSTVAILNIWA